MPFCFLRIRKLACETPRFLHIVPGVRAEATSAGADPGEAMGELPSWRPILGNQWPPTYGPVNGISSPKICKVIGLQEKTLSRILLVE